MSAENDSPSHNFQLNITNNISPNNVEQNEQALKNSVSNLELKNSQISQEVNEQSEKQLSEINFHEYDKIVFVGKSIGTVACQRYRHEHEINALSILLTPLTETFKFPAHDCAAFHGTSDPLADTGAIVKLCNEKKVILHTYNNANHSLEVRETFTDLNTLSDVLTKINKLL